MLIGRLRDAVVWNTPLNMVAFVLSCPISSVCSLIRASEAG